MPDTQTALKGIRSDAAPPPYPRLTPAAVERAKTKLGISDLNNLGVALGFSRQSFWRARRGEFDIPLLQAHRIADQLGWPVSRCFDNLDGGDRG